MAWGNTRGSRDVMTCPVPGCHRQHSRQLLMCPQHWKRVSSRVKDDVWRAYRNAGVLSEQYRTAREQAIKEASA